MPDDIGAISALADPLRRSAYQAVAAADRPMGRDEVAEALGIGRTLAAFHLDKLVDAGLLEVSYARRSGRSGPGAGRPAKLYRRSAAEHEVSLPPREYRTAAELLAEAVERAGADATLYAVAREHGRQVGAAGGELLATLEKLGYEPERHDASVRLRNCPFHQLANQFPPLVCGMNLALLEGLAAQLAPGCKVRMDRGPTGCCVVMDF
ncbi:MAG: helix-turn-helix domain-containing protein [Micromonosporaceae bacterium]|nr:helix-turn-helix domain-containing protein [Micromonosporaceae bacterium]